MVTVLQVQLVQLQADHERIEAAGVTLVAISYDSSDTIADFARRSKITFPLLSDPGSKTIDAYGIRDQQGDGYPHPQTFLVGSDGSSEPAIRGRVRGCATRRTP